MAMLNKKLIKKVKKGDFFKDAQSLFEYLGMEKTSSDTYLYKKQMEELEKYFSFTRKNKRIIIEKIYSKPQKKSAEEIKREGNNVKYADDLEYLLLELIHKNSKGKNNLGISRTTLYTQCKMVNDNYKESKLNREGLAQALDIPFEYVAECIEYVDGKLYNTLDSTLKRLQSKLVIKYGNSYMVKRIGEKEYSLASVDEVEMIMSAEYQSILNLGYRNKRAVYTKGGWSDHHEETQEVLKSRKITHILDFYDCVSIVVSQKDLARELKICRENYKKQEQMTRKEVEAQLNKKITNGLDETIQFRHNKSKELKDEEVQYAMQRYRRSDEYCETQKTVKNTIIDTTVRKINKNKSFSKVNAEAKRLEFKKKYYKDSDNNIVGEQTTFMIDDECIPF